MADEYENESSTIPADLNYDDPIRLTPLIHSIKNKERVLQLLDAGADINCPALLRVPQRAAKSRLGTPMCRYPIEFAAASSSLEIFKLLLERGAKLDGTYCLHAAAGGQGRGEPIKIMEYLINERNFDVNEIEFVHEKKIMPEEWKDRRYGTPLHYAAAWGFEDRFEYLLSKGADPQIEGVYYKDGSRWGTALDWQKTNREGNGYWSPRILELLGERPSTDDIAEDRQ